jgi:hypothetical protein
LRADARSRTSKAAGTFPFFTPYTFIDQRDECPRDFEMSPDAPPTLAWPLRNDWLLVALASAIAAAIWYLSEPIVITYDSFGYLNAANFIAGVEGGSFAYWRPPLVALLLAATGVPSQHTFLWFILAQIALGVASVMLMHGCLRRISRPLGLIATGLFIATFAPLVYSKSIMSEQLYLFGWCL